MRRLGVALIAPCVVMLAACGASSSPRGVVVSNAGLRLTGIHWVLTQVSHTGARLVTIPQFTGADLEFHRDGTVLADDGLNTLDAEFTATATTITMRNPSGSLVGYVGYDPVLDATRGSLGDMFDYQGDAGYSITARGLTVQIPSWTLTFSNSGAIDTAVVECPSGVEVGVPVASNAKGAPTPSQAVARYMTRPDPRLARQVGPTTHWHVIQEYQQATFYSGPVTLHVSESAAGSWLVDEGSYCQ